MEATISGVTDPEATIPGQADADAAFDWRNCWYPVAFLEDLPRERPTSFTLYDEHLVLFFDDKQQLSCLRDRCPHRAARLSDGRIIDGKLECLYHGWQFDAAGQCRRIPQLPEHLSMPAKSCARAIPLVERQGMAWIWGGEAERADPESIPSTAALDDPSVTSVDFQMDLPYDQSYLIENIIDVAHIHIAHDGIRGGGSRESAKPLQFDIIDNSIKGIRSGFKTLGLKTDVGNSPLKGAIVEYLAPNLIRYTSDYRDPQRIAGLALYSLPLGKSRCRLLYRKYSNFTSWRERWKPRWLEHWTQCTILEQDMGVVVGQYDEIERSATHLKDLWLPIKTSDRLVIEYRRWLDRFGRDLPFYRGFSSSKPCADLPSAAKPRSDRFSLHTKVCGTCQKTYRIIERTSSLLWVVVALLAALAALTPLGWVSTASVATALTSLAAIAGLGYMKRQFE